MAYLVFVVVAGSLISVPLYEAGQWAIETDLIPALKKFRFPKYLNRGVLIAALIGLWPFLKSLGLNGMSAIGLEKNPFARRHLVVGALLGALGLFGVSTWLVFSERLEILPKISPLWFLSAAATAVAADGRVQPATAEEVMAQYVTLVYTLPRIAGASRVQVEPEVLDHVFVHREAKSRIS